MAARGQPLHSVSSLLQLLRGRRVAFIGDSISGQVANALECALRREADVGDLQTARRVADAPDLAASCELVFDARQRGALSGQAFEESQCRALGPGTFSSRARELNATWMTLGGVHVPKFNLTFYRRFGDVYRYNRAIPGIPSSSRPPSHVQLVQTHALADTVILNFGLHDGNHTTYREAIRDALDDLEAFASIKGNAAIFRETSAQHFPAPSGDYHDALRKDPSLVLASPPQPEPAAKLNNRGRSSSGRGSGGSRQAAEAPKQWAGPSMCSRIAKDAPRHWRNQIVAELFAERGYSHVRLQPFEELTRGRWDFHSSTKWVGGAHGRGAWKSDCTHWCYSPCMWELSFSDLYRELAAALAEFSAPIGHKPNYKRGAMRSHQGGTQSQRARSSFESK